MARERRRRKGKEAFRLADEMLDKYGLSEAKRKKNKDMSKGMAQKVQLLSAIAHDPEFYILDEPFSGLDPVNQQVLESMVREIATRDSTVIFSTHVMEHAERLCDRIILMAGGRKVFDGPTEEALAKAPRRMVIGSDTDGFADVVTPFAKSLELREDGAVDMILKDSAKSQDVLERCVKAKINLTLSLSGFSVSPVRYEAILDETGVHAPAIVQQEKEKQDKLVADILNGLGETLLSEDKAQTLADTIEDQGIEAGKAYLDTQMPGATERMKALDSKLVFIDPKMSG